MMVNLTPHEVVVHGPNGKVVLSPSGKVARCASMSVSAGEHEGVPLFMTTFGEVMDLPPPQEGVLLVVSGLVRAAVPERRDVASPGELVRDQTGAVVGCRGLVVN